MNYDVVDLIKQDHREFERLFHELRTKPDQRPLLVPTLTAILTAHSRAEEAEVYPVARKEAGETEEVEHSQEEHAEAERLLATLAETDPESADFEKVLKQVVDSVTHHLEEEEETVLPGMRERLSDERRAELGKAFAASRASHLGDRPGEQTRDELELQARNAGVTGASSMSKEELQREVAAMHD
ncbi:hemerythrin domain-containing protein [Amycolatopsis suaedae]|uniref:Hemerythrin domain-containing protein n=1 Tax=Amycolatopsis suaedae TaxID=2510978 RepID=A0A4Q7J883_9PSEU|nr:hemerythrin domain-containing protein [Amycolatopsis suaedae]RZQ63890.1 hemerythrin domain-containing protein [Amycolatopsis suaedae]